jgi:hypothetical protein
LAERRPERGDEITLEPLRPRTFDEHSPVTAYWLLRCAGFRVVGRRNLTSVESAVYDDDPHRPVALRIRRGHRGIRLVPVEAVEGVSPLERIIYLRRRRSRTVAGLGAAARYGQRAGRASSSSVAMLSRSGSRQALRGSRHAIRGSRAAAVVAGRNAARGSRAAAVAARRRWPTVRHMLALAAQTALALAFLAVAFVVSLALAAAHALRATFVVLRRNAPRALADASLLPARRTFR